MVFLGFSIFFCFLFCEDLWMHSVAAKKTRRVDFRHFGASDFQHNPQMRRRSREVIQFITQLHPGYGLGSLCIYLPTVSFLGGGFKYFLSSPHLGEDFHFD